MLKPFANYLDERLEQWAAFYRQRVRLGISYPPYSMEYRMMTEGYVARQQYTTAKPMLTNTAAEEMEAYILALNKQYPLAADALRKHYLKEGNAQQKAKQLNISYDQFYHAINFARGWLLGRLSATSKFNQIIAQIK